MRLRDLFVRLYALAILLTGFDLRAHDPFDASVRMVVHGDDMAIDVTAGMDVARQILAASGLSKDAVADVMKYRGPRAYQVLPIAVAAQFFEIRQGDKILTARSAKLLCDGMEAIFTLVYPRPPGGTLDVRAMFYDTVENMRQGSFAVRDDNEQLLGGALLSRASPAIHVSLSDGAVKPGGSAPPASVDSVPAPPQPSFGQFLMLGIEHILTGFDHLLFLLALMFGVRKPAAMIGIISCFTLAHSVTLALSALDVVSIPSRIVEPLIAASIIVVCFENLMRKEATVDRLWLATGFGLIHGFGFAGALREAGLGQTGASLAIPLLSFNLGVEIGQIAVATLAWPILVLMRRWQLFERYGTWAVSMAAIVVSGYWLLERTLWITR